jgi:hypothetical protein
VVLHTVALPDGLHVERAALLCAFAAGDLLAIYWFAREQ